MRSLLPAEIRSRTAGLGRAVGPASETVAGPARAPPLCHAEVDSVVTVVAERTVEQNSGTESQLAASGTLPEDSGAGSDV